MSSSKARQAKRQQVAPPSGKYTDVFDKSQQKATEALHKRAAETASVFDSFSNPLARLGVGAENLMNSTEYPITRLTQNYQLLNSLYRNSWICKKIINAIPDDMCKNWFSISAELSPDIQDRYNKLEERTKTRAKIVEALYWGRLYGGAAAVILIDGHQDILDKPLELDDVMPDSYKGLMVLDRWSGIYPSNEIIEDIADPDFGLPMFYEVRDINNKLIEKVHHSRIIRFAGRILPFWEDIVELHWGASEMEHVFDELVKRDNTSWNIAALIFQANLLIDKVEGFDQMLALTDPQAQRDFYNIKQAQNILRNNNAMMLVGKEEDVTQMQYTFTGMSDVYNDFMLDISGAADMPVTRLFGRSPAGLNSDGEGDLQLYYDMISQRQNTELKAKIMKLLPIMFMSEFGNTPDDLDIKFNPVRTPSDQEIADLVGKKTEAIASVYNAGIINQKIAMKELHEISYTTNMFSNITDADIESASEEYQDESMVNDFGEQGQMGGTGQNRAGLPKKPEQRPENDK